MLLRRARFAVTLAFVVQGICFAALVTRIPTIQDRFELSDGTLGLMVGLVPIVAGIGSVVAGALSPRHGSRVVLRVTGPIVPLGLVLVGWAPTIPALLVALVVVGFGLGAVDASMNIQGVRVQDDLGHSVVAQFYAAFSLAGLVGAVLAALSADSSLSLLGFVALIAAVAVAVAPSPALALVAFAVLGFGICPAIPLAFTAAASHDKTSSGVAVARVNVFNYVGFVVGAPLIGGIAEGVSLRWAFAALVPVLLVVPLLAPWFRVAPHEAPDHVVDGAVAA
jgi:MFS family permease